MFIYIYTSTYTRIYIYIHLYMSMYVYAVRRSRSTDAGLARRTARRGISERWLCAVDGPAAAATGLMTVSPKGPKDPIVRYSGLG